jgi:hypothetical protein
MLTVARVQCVQERIYSILCHSFKVPAEYVVDISTALPSFEATCFLMNEGSCGGIGSVMLSVELELLRELCVRWRRHMGR